jgi:hypothetical protein
MADPQDSFGQPADSRETIQEIVRAIRRNLVRVVFTTLVCLMLGYGLTLIWPTKFESMTVFRMRDPAMLVGAIQAVTREDISQLSETKKVDALTNEMRSRKRVEDVMDELQWPEWLETAGKESERRDLVRKFGENLSVEMERDVTGVYVVTLTFSWTSPRKSMDFVNGLRDSWIQLTMDGYKRKLEDDADREEAMLRQYREDAQSAQTSLVTYSNENDPAELLSVESNHEKMVVYETTAIAMQGELESTVNEVERLQDELRDVPPEIDAPPEAFKAPPPAFPPGSLEEEAWNKLRATKAVVDEMSVKYTPLHSKLKAARSAYEEAQEAAQLLGIAEGPPAPPAPDGPVGPVKVQNPEYVVRALALEGAQTRMRELDSLLKANDAGQQKVKLALERLPEVTAETNRLLNEIKTKQALVEQQEMIIAPLRQKLNRFRSQSFGSESAGLQAVAGPFEILESAVEPEYPVLPIGPIIMAVALVLGVALGVSGPILAEMTRSSFGTVKEVSRALGVPVLGAVDLILTARDMRARMAQRLLTWATMLLVLASLATALYIYNAHPHVLPSALLRTIRDVKMALT